MKRKSLFCLCLCLCVLFSVLLNACAAPDHPVESSGSAEGSGSETISAPDDPNAKVVRAYLEELLTKAWHTDDEIVTWIDDDRVEAIRDCVKKLETPILTEEDVLALAEQAMTITVFLRKEQIRTLELPACGLMAGVWYSPLITYHANDIDCYTALMAYTLYLFTPPDYLFREDEVGDRSPLISSAMCLYLPLAGAYTSRSEALSLLQKEQNWVGLPLYGFAEGEHPLDCYLCGAPVLFCRNGEAMLLNLYDLAVKGIGDAEPSEEFRTMYAGAYVRTWINRFNFVYSSSIGIGMTYEPYQLPDGTWKDVCLLLTPEEARDLREVVELLSTPILTEEAVRTLALSMYWCLDKKQSFLLPGIDGRSDLVVGPVEEDPALLAHWVTAFLIDLFTPSAYRFEGVSPQGTGVSYAMQGPDDYYKSREEALADFIDGVTYFAWVGDDGVPYFIDRDGRIEPPGGPPPEPSYGAVIPDDD